MLKIKTKYTIQLINVASNKNLFSPYNTELIAIDRSRLRQQLIVVALYT